MTDASDAEIIGRLRQRVERAGWLSFITVESQHLRVLFARLDELEGAGADNPDTLPPAAG